MQNLRPIDHFYFDKPEPMQSCLVTLRHYILGMSLDITEAWKYGMPFFCYKGKMFCYLWFHKKYQLPYIGIVEGKNIEHPDLILEKRARMKILLIDPTQDLAMETIAEILKMALSFYV